MAKDEWEYGFYDSHPHGDWREPPQPQSNPVIVRRRRGSNEWEHVAPVQPDIGAPS